MSEPERAFMPEQPVFSRGMSMKVARWRHRTYRHWTEADRSDHNFAVGWRTVAIYTTAPLLITLNLALMVVVVIVDSMMKAVTAASDWHGRISRQASYLRAVKRSAKDPTRKDSM